MANEQNYYFTSESVTEGHPDKVCDIISDSVLDAILRKDPKARVACEAFISPGMVIVGGEITTDTYVNIQQVVRNAIKNIGYDSPEFGFNYKDCAVVNVINSQSPDIAQGVDAGGAGDQGLMIGFACRETPELMPMPIMLAHKLSMKLSETRKKKILPYLGPDGKTQITVEYAGGKPKRIETVVLSTQHSEKVLDRTGKQMTKKAKDEIYDKIIVPVLGRLIDKKTKIYINPTGKFVIGGPAGDTGLTGRKIIVDTYGEIGRAHV